MDEYDVAVIGGAPPACRPPWSWPEQGAGSWSPTRVSPDEVRDPRLRVLGGTPDSVPRALLVRQWSDDIVFFTHTGTLDPVDAHS